MKSVRSFVIAALGAASLFVSMPGQARDGVHISLPGISVRLPAPPLLPLPGVVVVREHRDDVYRGDDRRSPREAHRDYRDYRDHRDYRDRDDWRYERRVRDRYPRHIHHHYYPRYGHRHHRGHFQGRDGDDD